MNSILVKIFSRANARPNFGKNRYLGSLCPELFNTAAVEVSRSMFQAHLADRNNNIQTPVFRQESYLTDLWIAVLDLVVRIIPSEAIAARIVPKRNVAVEPYVCQRAPAIRPEMIEANPTMP